MDINNELVEIKNFQGEGYLPLVDFDSWRVAYLRFIDDLIPEKIMQVERHLETDEVFVLLNGEAVLFLGEGEASIEKLNAQVMEHGVIYNVKKAVWHTCVLSKDATILIVENKNTGLANTDYTELDEKTRQYLVKASEENIQDWRQ